MSVILNHARAAYASALAFGTDHPYLAAACAATVAALCLLRLRRRASGSGAVRRRLRSSSIGSTRFMASGTTGLDTYDTIISTCVTVEPLPSMDALMREWSDVVLPYQRFHSVPHQRTPLAPVEWIVQKVDVTKHFFQHAAPNETVARAVIDALSNDLLKDKSRPWWEVHVIALDGTKRGFVVIRIHHAIGDGVSLMEAMGPLMRDKSGRPLDLSAVFTPRPSTAKRRNIVSRVLYSIGYAASFVYQATRVVGFAALPGDPNNRFCNGQWPYTGNRVTVYFPTHSLSLIKQIKDKAGGGMTVNDVEFALFAGTVRRFLLKHDPDAKLKQGSMRSLTPFAPLERADPATKYATLLRNTFTFVVNDLPISQEDPLARLKASNRSWSRLKTSAAVPAAFFLHNLSSNLPLSVQRQTLRDLMSRMSVVFSNVPGPQEEVFLCGGSIKAVHMIYPILTPQVGILSLNGQVHMCISMPPDKTGLDIRSLLPMYFAEELKALAAAVGIETP